jgi:FkbM family methyltransferase
MSFRTFLAARLRRWSESLLPAKAVPVASPVIPPSSRYFYLGADVALTRLSDGHHIFVDPQDQTVSSHLIAHGFWEQWIHHVVCSLIAPGDRIVEVGANLGYYTIAMAVMAGPAGRVTAFEGNPRLCGLVQRSIEFNGYRDRVIIRNQAATDAAGPILFSISRSNSGGGHTTAHPGGATPEMEQIEVEGVRLDDAIEGDIDFLRMDAEGSEPLILHGAERLLSNPNLTVVMEWDVFQMSARASVPDLVEWLAAMGFQFWRIEHDTALTPISAEHLPGIQACDIVMARALPVAATR